MPTTYTPASLATLAGLHAARGETVEVNLPARTLRIGRKTLIDATYPDTAEHASVTPEEALRNIEELYAIYKHSIPSERSRSRRTSYFKALPEEELDAEDLTYGTGREQARAELETTLLLRILDGSLTWEGITQGQAHHWFWKSPADPDLILLRDWIAPATS